MHQRYIKVTGTTLNLLSAANCWSHYFSKETFFSPGVFCSFDWNLISFLFDKNDKLRERGNKSLGSANPNSYQTLEENKHFLNNVLHFVF